MYISFINNWKSAKEAVKATCQAKPAFAKFLEAMAREHKGKLALDSLLIMPVQRIPRYELLLQTLIKNTEQSHPDYNLLLSAQREVHVLAVKINCTERESMEAEQQQAMLRELENVIEGCSNIFTPDRVFLRFDLVSVTGDAAGSGNPERGLFLFNDLLIITTVKRRSGAIRKPSVILPANLIQQLEGNKHRIAMRLLLEDVEIVKLKDDILRDLVREVENLAEDAVLLTQMGEIAARLHTDHNLLDDIIREMLCYVNKQLSEHNGSESKLSHIEFIISSEGAATDSLVVVFSSQDKKADWEEVFNDAKQKLVLSAERRGSPEFVLPLPIRKTRAGLQFTCAAPTLGTDARDVWVCNSDGYVGQVCVLSLSPEPTVVSCNGVCNARILCIASVPAVDSGRSDYGFGHSNFFNSKSGISISVEDTDEGNLHYDSSSSSDGDYETEECVGADEEQKNNSMEPVSITATPSEVSIATVPASEDSDSMQPTMWLGTEDGCIHVYNCTDNIRIKKNKIKIQHGSSVHCIIYLDNRVFVSLANGDITVYTRDSNGGWNTTDPLTVGVGTAAMPVTRMLSIGGKLWCGCHNTIKILNTVSLNIEHSFQVNSDSSRSVTCLALAGFGVWISLQNSAVVKLFHAISYECLCDVNVAPAVTKMLQSCDDIIRQHKAACLRVTSLLACKDMLWIGTSAGVILNMRLPHITPSTTKVTTVPTASGMPHGHTGHVRFLTCVETGYQHVTKESLKQQSGMFVRQVGRSRGEGSSSKSTLLVISGGDGYEDFRTSGVSEVAGREDSTNHLLLWLV
ncbi:rho guanine nucleotide exchange factor 17 [Schistocerca piceifrons]|uniref:rho guanine nucleotide exchange factor 17 n=1 Tax=Schistocerca piceifrons TaxID=274613 RepID=UPI001F5F8DDA|nr:rho guanine nucleotide exchange factor 17 [Schistocerca piceifrons]